MSFHYNPALEPAVLTGMRVRVILNDRLASAETVARGNAPVQTGAYRDSISHGVGVGSGRSVGRLYATDFKAAWIEKGTSRMAAQRVLGNAVEQVGFRVGGARGHR